MRWFGCVSVAGSSTRFRSPTVLSFILRLLLDPYLQRGSQRVQRTVPRTIDARDTVWNRDESWHYPGITLSHGSGREKILREWWEKAFEDEEN